MASTSSLRPSQLERFTLSTSEQPFLLYRMARTRYANLSGVGAAAFPGRWNRQNQEAIYTSVEKSTPLLERLVHSPKDLIPSNLSLMTINLLGSWTSYRGMCVEDDTGAVVLVIDDLEKARQEFDRNILWSGANRDLIAVAIPSVIVPVWNVVLYPGANRFWEHIQLGAVEPFRVDERLFPEGAKQEPTDRQS